MRDEPGMLQPTELQRVGQDVVTEQQEASSEFLAATPQLSTRGTTNSLFPLLALFLFSILCQTRGPLGPP